MEPTLYPLKFKPILKDKLWGGPKLREVLGKDASEKTGESWEISGVEGSVSVVENGILAGNTLEELVEVYMGDIVGDSIFDRFGLEFPLLIKFIDAADFLSVQVHPGDELARERHLSFGKTEMWYILASDRGQLVAGFNRPLEKEEYLQHVEGGTLKDILNYEKVVPGDIYYMPAGRVHAIGPGVLLAEIQQTSDVTYRIYDWDRTGEGGLPRELHTSLALEAIDFSFPSTCKIPYTAIKNSTVTAVDSPYFTTGVIRLDEPVAKDFNLIDSFVIYMCMEGEAAFTYQGGSETIRKGQTVLIPAGIKILAIIPTRATTLLEIYIK